MPKSIPIAFPIVIFSKMIFSQISGFVATIEQYVSVVLSCVFSSAVIPNVFFRSVHFCVSRYTAIATSITVFILQAGNHQETSRINLLDLPPSRKFCSFLGGRVRRCWLRSAPHATFAENSRSFQTVGGDGSEGKLRKK